MQIEKHLLTGPNVSLHESPNRSGKFASGQPDTIVLHYTAGRSAKSSVESLSRPASKASAHLVVGRDGAIFQLVPFDTIAWHAGRSSFAQRSGLNQYAIGIEIDNAGPLLRTADGQFAAWFGGKYAPADVVEATHRNEHRARYWHRYSEEQIEQVEAICALLIAQYDIKTIVGHEEIAPVRKSDPGPAFPLDALRTRLLEARSSDAADDAAISSTQLNAAAVANANVG